MSPAWRVRWALAGPDRALRPVKLTEEALSLRMKCCSHWSTPCASAAPGAPDRKMNRAGDAQPSWAPVGRCWRELGEGAPPTDVTPAGTGSVCCENPAERLRVCRQPRAKLKWYLALF